MIITLIGIVLFIIGITLHIIEKKYYKFFPEWLSWIKCFGVVAGGIIVLICCLFMLLCQCPKKADIRKAQIKYEFICKELEAAGDDETAKVLAIQDVKEWNENTYQQKWMNDNPWFSWLIADEYADSLEYIGVEEND